MRLKRLIGPLALAAGLLGGSALAQQLPEPVPQEELEPKEAEDGELVEVTVDMAFEDADRDSEPEEPGETDLPPEIPIIVDGEQYTSEELAEKDIHISHYVLDQRSVELGAVQGFRTSEDIKAYLEETDQFPSTTPPEGWWPWYCHAFFFEHAGYSGNWFAVPPGWGYGNLGWFWNDRISSIWGSQCGKWTLVTEHANFKGHKLWIASNLALYNMSWYGWWQGSWWWPWWQWYSWNDRISSVWVYW